jgi:hypothetical protein
MRRLNLILFFELLKRTFSQSGLKIVQLFLILILTVLTHSSYAIEKETIEQLVNEERILFTPFELHISATVSAIINSSVSLNNEDAWLFFEYLSQSCTAYRVF